MLKEAAPAQMLRSRGCLLVTDTSRGSCALRAPSPGANPQRQVLKLRLHLVKQFGLLQRGSAGEPMRFSFAHQYPMVLICT